MSVLEALASGSLQLPTRPARIEAAATDAATVLVFADVGSSRLIHLSRRSMTSEKWLNSGGKRALTSYDCVGKNVRLEHRRGRVRRVDLPDLRYSQYRLANLDGRTASGTECAIYAVAATNKGTDIV